MNATTRDTSPALVTGGSKGTVRRRRQLRARVIRSRSSCYGSDEAGAASTVANIEAAGGKALAVRADVGEAAAVDQLFGEAEAAFGPVLVLEHAGIARTWPARHMSDAPQWDSVLAPNLTCLPHDQGATPGMMKALRAHREHPVGRRLIGGGQANYDAAKGRFAWLTRPVARELAPQHHLQRRRPRPDRHRHGLPACPTTGASAHRKRSRFRPLRHPEECGDAAAPLVPWRPGYITGVLLPVDGGLAWGH